MQEYFDSNKKLWNAKVPIHIDTALYNMEAFMAGETSLDKATLAHLGDVKGKRILHLQCHFGQDTLSLARMGAKVTGLDLSDVGIAKARELNDSLGLDAEFVCCNVYDAKDYINGEFDIVYTSYGTIVWLPDLDKWADIIQHFLAPRGKFVFLDFHPVIEMLNWDTCAFEYDYFNRKKPYLEMTEGTYADAKADIKMEEYFWTHSIMEVVQSLQKVKLNLLDFAEYDYSPYDVFGEMIERKEKEYVMKKIPIAFPYFYALVYQK